LALFSYNLQDPSWSSSGTHAVVRNWGGRLGAWTADIVYFLFGFSAWWCLAAGARAWLVALAVWLRGETTAPTQGLRLTRSRAAFWLGLAVLLMASCSMEWLRLYKFDANLPGQRWGRAGLLDGSFGLSMVRIDGLRFGEFGVGGLGYCLGLSVLVGGLAESIGAQIDG